MAGVQKTQTCVPLAYAFLPITMTRLPQDSTLGVLGPVCSRTLRWTNFTHGIGHRGNNRSDKPLFEKMLEFYRCRHALCGALHSALLSGVSKARIRADPLKQGCSL